MLKRSAIVAGLLAAVIAGVWVQQALSLASPAPKAPAAPAAKATPAPSTARTTPTASSAATSSVKAAASPATPSAQELTLDLGNGASMKLVLIRPGKFMMGGKEQHEVTLTKPYYLGVTLVTQAQYEAVMGQNPSRFKGPMHPVETIGWDDAADFCRKLSAKTRQTVRLPTEAEWEYACRAGTKTAFSFGDSDADLDDYGWYAGNSSGTTHPVAQKKPNPWGLYDMHGNVWEWCADWHDDYPKQAVTDPQGPGSAPYRIVRGGGYNYGPVNCRSANRGYYAPVDRDIVCGFRVAVSVSASKL
jgi:formylglycine-generating enzyme required for sulfatase activity